MRRNKCWGITTKNLKGQGITTDAIAFQVYNRILVRLKNDTLRQGECQRALQGGNLLKKLTR